MAWSAPRTWTTGELVTAAFMNAVRDQLLETAPAKVTTAEDLLVGAGANSLKRVAVGSNGQVLTVSGGAVGWSSASVNADLLPWIVDVHPPSRAVTNVGWNTIATIAGVNGSQLSTDNGNQNNEVTWPVVLSAGTWTIRLVHDKSAAAGIYTVQFDGVTKGTVDGYAAGGSANDVGDITGVAVATTAKITFRIVMATKNASSSNYWGFLRHVKFIRTA